MTLTKAAPLRMASVLALAVAVMGAGSALAGPAPASQPATGAIVGMVVSAQTGAPVVGVEVSLTSPALAHPEQVATDDAGVYRFSSLASARYHVAVPLGGTPHVVRVRAGHLATLDLSVVGGSIQGTITDIDTGKPLPGVTLLVTGPAEPSGLSAFGDGSGHYDIAGLPAGAWTVTGVFSSAKVERDGVVVAGGQPTTVNMAIKVPPAETYVIHSAEPTPRAMARGWLVEPKGSWSVGGALRFLMAGGGALGTNSVHFGDALLLGLNGAFSPTNWDQILANVTLLPTQPADTHEWGWQGDSLADRIALGKHFAVGVSGALGPVLVDHSLWQSASLGLEARHNASDTSDLGQSMVFTGWIGGDMTTYKLRNAADRTWLDDVFVDGEVAIHDPDAECCAAWLGVRFAFPVLQRPTESSPDPATGGFLAMRPWTTFRFGGTLSYIDDWDLWSELDVTSRGDLTKPGTTLPILDGGFSQSILEIGVTRHFGTTD
jgi:hypothetical protein